MPDPILAIAPALQPQTSPTGELRAAAQALEASFLSEMLKSSGFGAQAGGFGGGTGEEQFVSFLRDEHARAIAARGGIGLAEQIFQALAAERNGDL